MIHEMIRLQRGDKEVTGQQTIDEQQAAAEAKAREERELLNSSSRARLDMKMIFHNKPGQPCNNMP